MINRGKPVRYSISTLLVTISTAAGVAIGWKNLASGIGSWARHPAMRDMWLKLNLSSYRLGVSRPQRAFPQPVYISRWEFYYGSWFHWYPGNGFWWRLRNVGQLEIFINPEILTLGRVNRTRKILIRSQYIGLPSMYIRACTQFCPKLCRAIARWLQYLG